MYLIFNFVYILNILQSFTDCDSRNSVRLVGWLLIALHFYMFRDWYTVHSCLFADNGAFILASTLVPVEEFDDQSAWLRVVNGGSTFLLDAWSRHVLKCSNEWSLCWLCLEFWPSCTILLLVECCRLAQCICYIIYFVYILWCSTDRDPRTSVRLVLWLPCIFTSVEIDILCILAFS